MKQKILSGILAGVMAFTVMPMAVGAANKETKITFSDATYAKVGEKIEITVSIENNPGFVSATIPVEWDESKLKLDYVDKTEQIEGLLTDDVTPYGIEKCGWLGYEIYVLVKTIIAKRKAKKLIELAKSKIENADNIVIEDNSDSKN